MPKPATACVSAMRRLLRQRRTPLDRKRRGIAGELKQYKEQKNEVERFEQLNTQRVNVALLSNLEAVAASIGHSGNAAGVGVDHGMFVIT